LLVYLRVIRKYGKNKIDMQQQQTLSNIHSDRLACT